MVQKGPGDGAANYHKTRATNDGFTLVHKVKVLDLSGSLFGAGASPVSRTSRIGQYDRGSYASISLRNRAWH